MDAKIRRRVIADVEMETQDAVDHRAMAAMAIIHLPHHIINTHHHTIHHTMAAHHNMGDITDITAPTYSKPCNI